MGGRMLKRWIVFPLKQATQIQKRLDTVAYLIKDQDTNSALTEFIRQIGDVERLAARIPLKKATPRELVQLGKSIALMQQVQQMQQRVTLPELQQLLASMQSVEELHHKIVDTLSEDAPAQVQKGGAIKDGVHPELDELRTISRSGKEYLLKIQQTEAEKTGISSLKIAYNNVFGYYLEVTNAHKDKVPDTWIRKQTLANAERYITPELKEYEEKILGAEDKIMALEIAIYQDLLTSAEPFLSALQCNA